MVRRNVLCFLKRTFWLQQLPLNLKFQIILKPRLFEIFINALLLTATKRTLFLKRVIGSRFLRFATLFKSPLAASIRQVRQMLRI